MIKENNPIASAKPAPINATLCNLSSRLGFLEIPCIKDAKILPTPIEAPIMPIAINPAPIYFKEV